MGNFIISIATFAAYLYTPEAMYLIKIFSIILYLVGYTRRGRSKVNFSHIFWTYEKNPNSNTSLLKINKRNCLVLGGLGIGFGFLVVKSFSLLFKIPENILKSDVIKKSLDISLECENSRKVLKLFNNNVETLMVNSIRNSRIYLNLFEEATRFQGFLLQNKNNEAVPKECQLNMNVLLRMLDLLCHRQGMLGVCQEGFMLAIQKGVNLDNIKPLFPDLY